MGLWSRERGWTRRFDLSYVAAVGLSASRSVTLVATALDPEAGGHFTPVPHPSCAEPLNEPYPGTVPVPGH